MPVAFEPFLRHIPAFMLVLFRITGIFVMAPVFGGKTVPMRVKVLLTFSLALCVYPAFAPVAGLSSPGTPVHSAAASILERGTNLSMWVLPVDVISYAPLSSAGNGALFNQAVSGAIHVFSPPHSGNPNCGERVGQLVRQVVPMANPSRSGC